MMRSTVSRRFFEALLFAVSSLVLYFFGVTRFLFLVPLQVASVQRGTAGIAAAGGIAVAALAVIRLAGLLPAPLDPVGILPPEAEVAVFLLLAGGLTVANLRLGGARALLRLLAGTAAACLVGAPLLAILLSAPAAAAHVDARIAAYAQVIREVTVTGDSVVGTVLEALVVPDMLKSLIRESVLNSVVPSTFAFLAFARWAGSAAGGRAAGLVAAPRWRFASFRLGSRWLWPLIASLVLVAADLLGLAERVPGDWGAYASYAAWNAAFLILFLYGLQGLAILRFWLEKRGVARFTWPLAVAIVLMALITPRLNAVVAVALPLFGASENWVRYRSGGAAAT
jgi:hypothetical protein